MNFSDNFESVRRQNVQRREKINGLIEHLQSYEEVAGARKVQFTMPALELLGSSSSCCILFLL